MTSSRAALRTKVAPYLEGLVILAAIATIPVTVAEETGRSGSLLTIADWVVWGVFLVEFVVMVVLTEPSERWDYAKRNWLSPAIVLLSFPLLPPVFALTRWVRVLRVVLVAARALRGFDSIFGRKGLIAVAAITLVLVFAGGGLVAVIEPDTVTGGYWSGVWWAIVTTTTVGYGDIAPVSLGGQFVATILMFAGLGLVATLAASIAAYFVGKEREEGEEREEEDFRSIAERLDRLEGAMRELTEAMRTSQPRPPPG